MIANELSNEQGHIESASGLLVDLMPDGVEAGKRKAAEQGISDHGTADGKSECDNISRAYDGEDMGL